MLNFVTNSSYFGLLLTIGVFSFSVYLNRKHTSALTTPLLTSTILVVAILLLCKIPYSVYNASAKYITYFLVPVTVCFAVPMYRQLDLLKRNIVPILLGIFIGSVASVLSVCIFSVFFGLGDIIAKSLVAISTTTAIAIEITQELGGIPSITTSAVIITGVLGASISDLVCRFFGWKNPISCGIAIGNSAHAAGTIKALQMGKLHGAASSLAIVISGVMTAFIAPVIIKLFFN